MGFHCNKGESAWNLVIFIAPKLKDAFQTRSGTSDTCGSTSLQSIVPGSSSSPINIIQNEMSHKYLMAPFLQLLEK